MIRVHRGYPWVATVNAVPVAHCRWMRQPSDTLTLPARAEDMGDRGHVLTPDGGGHQPTCDAYPCVHIGHTRGGDKPLRATEPIRVLALLSGSGGGQ